MLMVESETLSAYVLVITKVGSEHQVKETIEEIAQEMEGEVWVEVKPVFGEYDLIVIIEAKSIRSLDKLVSKMRMLEDVVKTVTLIAS